MPPRRKAPRVIAGGGPPADPALAKGFYIEPTVFADVTMSMRIAREEIFGPVLGVFKWSDEAKMLAEVNQVEYGLTASIWTNDLSTAHRTAMAVEAGFVWINEVRQALPGRAVRRLQAVGPRARGMFRGDALLHAGEEHPREAEAGESLGGIKPARRPHLAAVRLDQEAHELGRLRRRPCSRR